MQPDLLQRCKAELAAIEADLEQMKHLVGPETEMVRARFWDVWARITAMVAVLEREEE